MGDFEVNKRLEFLIREVYGTNPHAFSQKYKDKKGVRTSQVIRERNGLSYKLLELILEAYPEINKSWLLTGEGDILKRPIPHNTGIFINESTLKDSQVVKVEGERESSINDEPNAGYNLESISALKQEILTLKATVDEQNKLLFEKERLVEEKERLIKILLEKSKL